MFIKAHVRGGYRAAAKYLMDKGENELSQLVHISDADARNLDEAFHNMWLTASETRATKPLFHFSINPYAEERLSLQQVQFIAASFAKACGMKLDQHQHVIVEHVKGGRQHFHVVLSRVNEETGRVVDPGLYKKKAKECARQMEIELGLKRLVPTAKKSAHHVKYGKPRNPKRLGQAPRTKSLRMPGPRKLPRRCPEPTQHKLTFKPAMLLTTYRQPKNANEIIKPGRPHTPTPEHAASALIAWAWENKRADILLICGIRLPNGFTF